MKAKKIFRNEKGFTLIEIIAVIIIMGILAAVAVPKFFSMQDDAREAAVDGALSEAASRFNLAFSRYILDLKKAPTDVATDLKTLAYLGTNASDCTVGAAGGETIGDFRVCWQKTGTDGLIIEVLYAETIPDATLAAMRLADLTSVRKTLAGVNWD